MVATLACGWAAALALGGILAGAGAFAQDHDGCGMTVPAGAAQAAPDDAPAALPALAGDAEYGEYLAQECTTCHQRDGSADGIPQITGWPADSFAMTMQAYRSGERIHPVMQMVARQLDDEQIAALAAYFGSLGE